jgi:tetratricopeptide (TPR) repeat protein
MHSARAGLKPLLAALTVLAGACLASAAPAPDKDQDLRNKALKLNDVTGEDPVKGEIERLIKDGDTTKKLLDVAEKMIKDTKDKDQPFNYNASYILARSAQKLDQVGQAETFYRLAAKQALELKSATRLAQAYNGLIEVLFDEKKYEDAEKICREFLGLPSDETIDRLKVLVLRRLIQAFARQNKFDDANKILNALIKAQPDNWLTLELKGWVQREAGQYDDSAKTYEDVLERINKDKDLTKEERKEFAAEIRYTLSNVYLELKKLDKVTEELQSLIDEDPENPGYKNDLGYIWADHDMHLDKAEKLIREALELDKKKRKEANPDLKPEEDHDNGAYLDSLGWVLFKKKQYKEAKEALLQAVKDKEGQNIEIYDHLGEVYMALGDKDEAVSAWKKGLDTATDSKRDKEKKAEVEKKLKDNK